MNDELDQALRDQARTYRGVDRGTAPGLDDVVRRSRARRRTRLVVSSTVVVLIAAMAVAGLAAGSEQADLSTYSTSPTALGRTTVTTSPPPETTPASTPGTTGESMTAATDTTTTSTIATPSPSTTAPAGPSTTPAPTSTTPTAGVAVDPTCTWQPGGLRLTYPEGWSTDPSCSYFDPKPFVVPVPSDTAFSAISVARVDGDLASMIAATQNAPGLDSDQQLTVGSFSASCNSWHVTGEGIYPVGTRFYRCLVAYPSGLVGFETVGYGDGTVQVPGTPNTDTQYDAVVRMMVERAVPIR